MLTAYNEQLEQVFAQHASKQEQYFCPICKAAVILKQGTTKNAHFAHQSNLHSARQMKGESEQHHRCKSHLYLQLKESHADVKLEPYLKAINQIPDLIVGRWALEIQLSMISCKRMRQRTVGLTQLGYYVLWLTALPKIKQGRFILTQLHQQAILPESYSLFCINTETDSIYRISQLVPLTATQFYGEMTAIPVAQLCHYLSHQTPEEMIVRKLSTATILSYIRQCRQKNNVREPTISLLYQLQLTDEQVIKLTGFLFPEQIYIRTHPVLWQLWILKSIQSQLPSHALLAKNIKLRQFAVKEVNASKLINTIVARYIKFLNL
ncbi:competence protein CoiA [Staphylococcus schleiferi]|uniref:competence protein CoiA n=1 Tax=Staphylococcus schleiferi TaxID=1295 RepID=UPI0014305A93|nr:competence protein CoiA family protein [Staphylococcus schleiferi]NHA42013.1 competence protein CoiA [Staphylococcus schleiferi]